MMTGFVTAVLILLALGLAGATGWLAALVLAMVAGVLLAGLVQWITAGNTAMDASQWDPRLPQTVPVAPSHPPARAPSTAPEQEDLRLTKGVGPKVEAALVDMGVTRLTQIAAWDEARIDEVAARTGRAASRIRGDDWVGQAKALVAARRALDG